MAVMEEKIKLGTMGILASIFAALPIAAGVLQREWAFAAGSAAVVALIYFLFFFHRKYMITGEEIIARSGVIKLKMEKKNLKDILVVGPSSGYALAGIRLANTFAKQIYVLNPNNEALVVTPSQDFVCELHRVLEENLRNDSK